MVVPSGSDVEERILGALPNINRFDESRPASAENKLAGVNQSLIGPTAEEIRLEEERLAKLEAERLEQERIARLEVERLEEIRLEKQRLAKLEAEKKEKARIARIEQRKNTLKQQILQEENWCKAASASISKNADIVRAKIRNGNLSAYKRNTLWTEIQHDSNNYRLRDRQNALILLRQELARLR